MALFGLLAHPLLDLLAQVIDVVLRHQHLDAVHELVGRARGLRDDLALLDEMDRHVETVNGDPVADIAVQAVCFLNQDGLACGVCLQKGDHLAEAGATGLFGRFDVDELPGNV